MKYVIDVEPTPYTRRTHLNGTEQRWQIHGTNAMLTESEIAELEMLNGDYISENFGQFQDEAYERGKQDVMDKLRELLAHN